MTFCGTFIAVCFTVSEADGNEQSSEWRLSGPCDDDGKQNKERHVNNTQLISHGDVVVN
jgi:hypothetical protein